MAVKWADMTPEEQQRRKDAMAEGRRNAAERQAAEKAVQRTLLEAKAAQADNSVEVSKIAVNGVVMDSQGNTWTLPADNFDDDPIQYKSELAVPKREPGFYYQWFRDSEVPDAMLDQFVPVTLKEQGLDKFQLAPVSDYGKPLDGYFRKSGGGNSEGIVCMKIPEVLEKKLREPGERLIKQATSQVRRGSKVAPDSANHTSSVESHTSTSFSDPKVRPALPGSTVADRKVRAALPQGV